MKRDNSGRKVRFLVKGPAAFCFVAFLMLTLPKAAAAGGPFGPPQPHSRESGGLATAVGYWRYEAQYENGKEQSLRQNQGYSQVGYGARYWEAFGRIGITDLKISDAFGPTQASTITSKNDFEDYWEWYGTLGAKGFYPLNRTFGLGAFLQGTYYFNDFIDKVSGSHNGVPFESQFKVSNFWDVALGLGLQITIPANIKLYLGPYGCYSEATVSSSRTVPGLGSASGSYLIHNRTGMGGFAGFYLPLARGFHLNVEGQYSDRFSVGTAIVYVY
jgi:hypothetical protein